MVGALPPLGHRGAYADVASANSTLNTLMPGRQKSWMTSGPMQPSPRPRRPRPQDSAPRQSRDQTHPQTQPEEAQPTPGSQASPALFHHLPQGPSTPANVLPSPAPSNEPSPAALSNYKDSPNSQTLSLAAVSRDYSNTTSTSTQDPAPNPSLMLAIPDPGPVSPEATSPEQAGFGPLVQAVQPPAMPPPDLPNGNQAGQSPDGTTVVRLSSGWESRPSSAVAQENPNKRRRMGTSITFAELAASIDRKIAQAGGMDKLTPDVEGPRFALLKNACVKGDVFYLHLHSLFCLWSYNPQSLPPILSHDLDATHRGFSILETVLKQNSGFTQENLMWCAAFPHDSFNTDSPEGVKMVANFLTGLSQYWPTLSPAPYNRHYPYLVDELLGHLQCYSETMQRLLFTASRRRLGIKDGPLGDQMESLFRSDQKQHMDEKGSFRQVVTSGSPEDPGYRNHNLIRAYRQVWSMAKAEQGETSREIQRRQEQFRQQQEQQQARALLQQQQMRNNPSSSTLQQPSQTQPHFQLGQLQEQMPQGQPGQQHQMNTQWSPGQVQGAQADYARRATLNMHETTAQPVVQFASPPQSSGPFSGAGTSPALQDFFAPQSVGVLPQSLILSSNSPTSPSVPGTVHQAQHLYNMSQQQQQPQFVHGQNHAGMNPWFASTPSLAVTQNPQMSNVRIGPPSVSPNMGSQQTWSRPQPGVEAQLQPLQPRTGQQQLTQLQLHQLQLHQQQQMRQQMRQQQLRQQQTAQQPAAQTMSSKHRLVPPPGHVIDRSEHPHSHQEKKSLLMSLHQAHARSPDRTRRNGVADERYYQSVHSLAVQPFRLTFFHEVSFDVSPEQYSRICKQKTLPRLNGDAPDQSPVSLPIREYSDGSLRFRVRCCRLRSDKVPIQESDWVTKDMMWPEHIFVHVNEQKLAIRRGTHNGKDLPIELSDFLLSGTNKLKVAVPRAGPSAADKRGKIFFLAVEIVEISSHTELLRNIERNNRADREETLEKIRKRVNAAPDEDDEIAVIDRTGSTAHDLSISLTDPFSASIFRTPARGATCSHLECFDLETWLTTRPIKQPIKCGHREICTCPKRLEPTEPDKWKCPICFEDARPCSLRIDSFLEDVRKQLEERNQLDVKSILVAADGTWRPVDELDDDDGDDDDDAAASDATGPASGVRRSISALQRSTGPNNRLAPVERGRAPIEVIELD